MGKTRPKTDLNIAKENLDRLRENAGSVEVEKDREQFPPYDPLNDLRARLEDIDNLLSNLQNDRAQIVHEIVRISEFLHNAAAKATDHAANPAPNQIEIGGPIDGGL